MSALYIGSVMHRRVWPRRHRFKYRCFWLLLDLDEIEYLSKRLHFFSRNAPNIFAFRDADYGDGSSTPLRTQIETRLAAAGIAGPFGRLALLTMPRTLGYGFNPISVWFCYRPGGELAATVQEVHNTYGERHFYVMAATGEPIHQQCAKAFYVSPFLEMAMDYDFRIRPPGEHVMVGIAASVSNRPVLSAVLSAERHELTDWALLRVFFAIPAVTVKVIAAIHWQAVRLRLKGMRVMPRPTAPVPAE